MGHLAVVRGPCFDHVDCGTREASRSVVVERVEGTVELFKGHSLVNGAVDVVSDDIADLHRACFSQAVLEGERNLGLVDERNRLVTALFGK
jgi:hypothetical protein